MIYRTLITGNDKNVIDSFFGELGNKYTLMSTSERRSDIENHIGFFSPEIMVFCLDGESDEFYRMISGLEGKFEKKKIKLFVTGSEADVESFQKKTDRMAHIVLKKPASVLAMDNRIQDFMAKNEVKENASTPLGGAVSATTVKPAATVTPDKVNSDPNRKKLILAIDDEPLMLKVIQEQLKDRFDVATAINGKLAYRYLEKKSPDVILLDYEMPEESGPQVMEKIRSNPSYKNVPIIFLTGVTDMDKIKSVLALKPQGYILKPLNREKLLDAIEKVI